MARMLGLFLYFAHLAITIFKKFEHVEFVSSIGTHHHMMPLVSRHFRLMLTARHLVWRLLTPPVFSSYMIRDAHTHPDHPFTPATTCASPPLHLSHCHGCTISRIYDLSESLSQDSIGLGPATQRGGPYHQVFSSAVLQCKTNGQLSAGSCQRQGI
jgi:hypothetical protein